MNTRHAGNIGSTLVKNKFIKLKNFFKESRQAQTDYSEYAKNKNEELNWQEKSSIEEFLISEMFLNKKTESTYNLSENEEEIVKNLTEKIIEVSPSDNSKTCVRIIWVFYFFHEKAEAKCIPVFKIYNSHKEKKVKYLDVFLKDYSFWDDFIEKVPLSKSLMCVPRNGEYSFQGGTLNLEYIAKDLKLDLNGHYRLQNLPNFQPVSMAFSDQIKRICSWWSEHCPAIFTAFIKIIKEHKGAIICCLLELVNILLISAPPSFLVIHPTLMDLIFKVINFITISIQAELIAEDCKIINKFNELKSLFLPLFNKHLKHQVPGVDASTL